MADADHPIPFRDAAHATMQREYTLSKESEGWTLFGTEVPYSNGLGFVDVVMFRERPNTGRSWLVAELKPTMQNVGEAIRQVRRAQQLFFRSYVGLPGSANSQNHGFPLVVLASEENWRRCAAYSALFTGIELKFFHPDPTQERAVRSKFEIETAILAAARPRAPLSGGVREASNSRTSLVPESIPVRRACCLPWTRSRPQGPAETVDWRRSPK